jgi:hypothetical protein
MREIFKLFKNAFFIIIICAYGIFRMYFIRKISKVYLRVYKCISLEDVGNSHVLQNEKKKKKNTKQLRSHTTESILPTFQ